MRIGLTLAACSALAANCVVYRDAYTVTETVPCEDCGETEEIAPEVHPDLFLSINAGIPGANLLTTLEARTERDFREVMQVSFERDVTVADQILRDDEIVLLLDVASESEPGDVDVFVEVSSGQTWVLRQPFQIQALDTPPVATGDTGAP